MYCRHCGQKLSLRFCENEGLIPYCNTCESYMFPQFSVAVSMVVTNRTQDKILLAKHVEDEDYILFAGYAEWYFTQEGVPGWGAGLVESLSPAALGWVYSIVYNGMYMIPEMVLTAAAALLIARIPGIVKKQA